MTVPIDVSVVVPVYNARPFLPAFVASLRQQSLSDYELIAVDDGSTDGSGVYLDSLQKDFPQLRVIHQENSGWAGAPRNRGIEQAKGRYIFFADPDDVLGDEQALESLVRFADEHGSDVVVPKMVASGGRTYAQGRYATTQVDADLPTVFTTLTPQKLFRRSLLLDHSVRFPEGKVRLEDGIFLSRAYLLASRVSILVDRVYYVLVHHDEGDHLSKRAIDPEAYLQSVSTMVENVDALCRDRDTTNRIIAELVQRKATLGTQPKKAVNARPKRLRAWFAPQREFVERHLQAADRRSALRDEARILMDAAMDDDAEGLKEWASAYTAQYSAVDIRMVRGALHIRGDQSSSARGATVELVERIGTTAPSTVPIDVTDDNWELSIPKGQLSRTRDVRLFDVYMLVETTRGTVRRRVAADLSEPSYTFTDGRTVTVYTTVRGNLSIRVSEGLGRIARLRRRARRMLRRKR